MKTNIPQILSYRYELLVSLPSGRAINISAQVKVSRGIMHGIAALQVNLTFFSTAYWYSTVLEHKEKYYRLLRAYYR